MEAVGPGVGSSDLLGKQSMSLEWQHSMGASCPERLLEVKTIMTTREGWRWLILCLLPSSTTQTWATPSTLDQNFLVDFQPLSPFSPDPLSHNWDMMGFMWASTSTQLIELESNCNCRLIYFFLQFH